jgi:hypothetical protein
MQPDPQVRDLPEEIRSKAFVKKLAFIAAEGRKRTLEDSGYGQACACLRCRDNPFLDPSRELEKMFFRLGPKGQPYSDVSNACEAGNDANNSYGEMFDGHFEWHSQVYEEDAGKSKKQLGRNYRGWLRIRFIPNGVQK